MSIDEQDKTITGVVGVPDLEVVPQAKCRRFSAQYKLRILEEADRWAHLGRKLTTPPTFWAATRNIHINRAVGEYSF